MSLREEQCKKICRILDDVLANRPTERDSLIVAVQLAFKALSEPHWIPCSERLPDMHDEVLVTARGEVSIAWLYVDGKWRSNDMPQPMFKDIIAWMPLPEPYKGVTE